MRRDSRRATIPTAPSTSRLAAAVLTAASLGVSVPADARIEKLAGRAFGEIDPSDPRNAVITDLASAPRNAAGKVEYSMDVYLLKPVYMTQASGRLFYESN